MPALHAAPAAGPDQVSLHVGVHREAGTLYDVAADGADGQCAPLGQSWLVCPASGPVRFRWGPGGDWALHGVTELTPGQTGAAFVLPPDAARQAELDRLAGPITPQDARELFVGTSARVLPPPSPGMVEALVRLAEHPDWRVRREVVRGLFPFARHTGSDPFPADAPSLLPPGLLSRLAADPARQVRQRTAVLLRELLAEDPRAPEAAALLPALRSDPHAGVRRAAFASTAVGVPEGLADPLEAWAAALARVPEPAPVGRAASNALARLKPWLAPDQVDADAALALVLRHHPERAWRVWTAWRDAIPFDAGRVALLLRQTTGLSEGLVLHWAQRDPDALAAEIAAWEPAAPHSERFRVMAGWLEPRTVHPGLRAALALPQIDRMSVGPDGPPANPP